MDNDGFIIALDLGSSNITGVVGKKENNKITVIAVERESSTGSIRRGKVVNIDIAAGIIKKIITKLENKSKIKIESVYVGINGQSVKTIKHTISRHLPEGSIITSNFIQELYNEASNISLNSNYIIDIIPNEIRINDQIVADPEGMAAKKIQINMQLAVARQTISNSIAQAINKIGIKIDGLILSPKADAVATLTKDERQNGCALVNFGGGTTTVSIYKSGYLQHQVTIPLGGKDITKDIASLGFIESEAERLKTTLGSAVIINDEQLKGITLEGNGKNSIKPKDLNRIIVARQEEIVVNINNQIKESGLKAQLKQGIVINGGASQMKDLPELIRKETNLEVHCGSLHNNIIIPQTLNIQTASYSQIIGLLMLSGTIQIQEIVEEEEIVEEVKKSSKWGFGRKDKEPKPISTPPQMEEKPKPKEKKGGGFFDKMKNQIMKAMDESENENV